SGRFHVAVLAVPAGPAGGTGQPLRVGGVDRHAEHDPLVARGTEPAVALEGRVTVLAAIDVVERPEEQITRPRTQQAQGAGAVGQAGQAVGGAGDLVAEVAVDALGGDARYPAQIEQGGVVVAHGRRVAGGADARAVGVLVEQAPARLAAVPVAAV